MLSGREVTITRRVSSIRWNLRGVTDGRGKYPQTSLLTKSDTTGQKTERGPVWFGSGDWLYLTPKGLLRREGVWGGSVNSDQKRRDNKGLDIRQKNEVVSKRLFRCLFSHTHARTHTQTHTTVVIKVSSDSIHLFYLNCTLNNSEFRVQLDETQKSISETNSLGMTMYNK